MPQDDPLGAPTNLPRSFFVTLIGVCVLATLLGTVVLATVVHRDTTSALLNGPWKLVSTDGSSSTWRAHRDEDAVRLQMRRVYRLVNTSNLPISNVQIRQHGTDRALLDLEQPGPVIAFGKPQLRSDDATPWQDMGAVPRDTRLEVVVVVELPEVDRADLPIFETRIKPDRWIRWPRISGR